MIPTDRSIADGDLIVSYFFNVYAHSGEPCKLSLFLAFKSIQFC